MAALCLAANQFTGPSRSANVWSGGTSPRTTDLDRWPHVARCSVVWVGSRLCHELGQLGGDVATVVFVHGTGVRQSAYDAAFARFAKRIAQIRPGHAVAQCFWGGPHGSRLNAAGVSIPSGTSHRSLDDPLLETAADDDAEVALWGLLEHDPIFELRLLSADDLTREELPPNVAAPGQALAAAARRLPANASVASRAAIAGLDSVLPDAVEAVLANEVTVDVLRRESDLGGTLRAALARAFVTEALLRADEELGGTFPLDGAHRDALTAAVAAGLGGSDRGIGGSVGRLGLKVAFGLGATRPAERRRSAITEAAAPAAGDVLMYLARGEPIRSFIADTVAAVEPPVALVAHSLGGIASVDLLATRAQPAVELLVTVGSQAPFLYELNALPALEFGAQLPPTVPRWVNIFDRRDLLAYTGARVFPGRVEDREVDNRAPFPRSHSAYFVNEHFWAVLDEVL